MNRERSLVKNTAILSIGIVLPKFASVVLLPLLTGYLTKVDYGTYDLIVVLASLVLPTLTLQIQQAAFRFLIDARDKEEDSAVIITNIMGFLVPVSTIGAAVLFFLLPIDYALTSFLVCLYYWIDVVENALIQCSRGMGDNMTYSISALICSGSHLLFALIFVCWLKLGLMGSVLMLLASDIAELVYILIKSSVLRYIHPQLLSIDMIKSLIKYSWPLVPNSMSLWIMRLSNRLVIIAYLGAAANAVFAVAYKFPQILNLIQNTFTMAWQENASIAESDDDKDEYYSKMFSSIYDLAGGLMGLLIAAIPVLFKILIRGNYDEAYSHIPILCMGMFFYYLSGFLGGIYVAKKRTSSIGITTIVAAAINLLIDVFCLPIIGLYGASLAIYVSYLILCLYRMYEVKKFTNIHYGYPKLVGIVIILHIMGVLCFIHTAPCFIANALIGLALFVVLDYEKVLILIRLISKRLARR